MASPASLSQDLDHVLAHTEQIWQELRNASVFITGGTGFVGTWLVESFVWANRRLNLGAKATLITRNPEAFARKAPHVASDPSVQTLRGDACSFEFPEGEFPFVIHAATESGLPPIQQFDRDVQATRHVLEFARTHGTRRLLFTSSGAVYGKQPSGLSHIPEDYAGAPSTMDPVSTYGQAKRVSEWMCGIYARQFGFNALIARLFAFVGPHLPLDINYAVGNFVRDVLAGGPVRIGGDGTPYRSYLYAADLAIWLWTILAKGESLRPYNVGAGEALSIADLARTVVDATVPGIPIEIAQKVVPGAAPARYVPSIQRAGQELGLQPLIDVREGIRRTYAWHRDAYGCSMK